MRNVIKLRGVDVSCHPTVPHPHRLGRLVTRRRPSPPRSVPHAAAVRPRRARCHAPQPSPPSPPRSVPRAVRSASRAAVSVSCGSNRLRCRVVPHDVDRHNPLRQTVSPSPPPQPPYKRIGKPRRPMPYDVVRSGNAKPSGDAAPRRARVDRCRSARQMFAP